MRYVRAYLILCDARDMLAFIDFFLDVNVISNEDQARAHTYSHTKYIGYERWTADRKVAIEIFWCVQSQW